MMLHILSVFVSEEMVIYYCKLHLYYVLKTNINTIKYIFFSQIHLF